MSKYVVIEGGSAVDTIELSHKKLTYIASAGCKVAELSDSRDGYIQLDFSIANTEEGHWHQAWTVYD